MLTDLERLSKRDSPILSPPAERTRIACLKALDVKKPVVPCGDLNVTHEEIDLKNPQANRGNAGFSDEERAKFSELLAAGFTDRSGFCIPAAMMHIHGGLTAPARANET